MGRISELLAFGFAADLHLMKKRSVRPKIPQSLVDECGDDLEKAAKVSLARTGELLRGDGCF